MSALSKMVVACVPLSTPSWCCPVGLTLLCIVLAIGQVRRLGAGITTCFIDVAVVYIHRVLFMLILPCRATASRRLVYLRCLFWQWFDPIFLST